MSDAGILVAGIGNIFLGDDAFGCEAVRLLSERKLPESVRVADFGIRGFDLAYALLEDYDAFILVDAVPHGQAPGTLYTIEVDVDELAPEAAGVEAHSMNPVNVLTTAVAMGGHPRRVFVVGCEPMPGVPDQYEEYMGLSEPVQAALPGAVEMIESLIARLNQGKKDNYEQIMDSAGVGSGSGGGHLRGS